MSVRGLAAPTPALGAWHLSTLHDARPQTPTPWSHCLSDKEESRSGDGLPGRLRLSSC